MTTPDWLVTNKSIISSFGYLLILGSVESSYIGLPLMNLI